jgi:hypothetical protein
MNLRPTRALPARSALIALTALLLMTARGSVPAAHGAPTVIANVPCGAIVALVDGNAGNAIISADVDAACGVALTPLPPTGTRSIAALAGVLGNQNGVLEFNDFIGIPSLNVNQIAATCTAPSLTCTLEWILGSDPLKVDTDGDKIIDGVEFKGYNTSPALPDSDGDLCRDGREIASVNDDLKVNTTDLLIVAQNVGRADRPGIDINKDGKVNMTDLLIVAKNFTSTVTC